MDAGLPAALAEPGLSDLSPSNQVNGHTLRGGVPDSGMGGGGGMSSDLHGGGRSVGVG